jgi:RNA polymerase sigma-70 factor (ECF subfamily)
MAPAEDPLPILMQRYQAGDEEAFAEIYRLTASAIRRYVGRWIDPSRTSDVTQETFLQMHKARRTYRPELPFRPWLYAIARHVAQQALRTHARKAGRETAVDAFPDHQHPSTEQAGSKRLEIEQALVTLPEDQREAFWLSEVEGLTSVEISKITGVSEGAIRVRLHRARKRLAEFAATAGRAPGAPADG